MTRPVGTSISTQPPPNGRAPAGRPAARASSRTGDRRERVAAADRTYPSTVAGAAVASTSAISAVPRGCTPVHQSARSLPAPVGPVFRSPAFRAPASWSGDGDVTRVPGWRLLIAQHPQHLPRSRRKCPSPARPTTHPVPCGSPPPGNGSSAATPRPRPALRGAGPAPSTPTPTPWPAGGGDPDPVRDQVRAVPLADAAGARPARVWRRPGLFAGRGPVVRRRQRRGQRRLVVGYPTADRAALAGCRRRGRSARVTLMVDSRGALDLIDAVVAARAGRRSGSASTSTPRCGFRRPDHIGALRSPVHSAAAAAALAAEVAVPTGVRAGRADGLRGSDRRESGDQPPGRPFRGWVRAMQARSAARLAERRAAAVAAVEAVAPLEFVNGGGTGSLERTSAEAASPRSPPGRASTAPGCSTATRLPGHARPRLRRSVVRRPGPGARWPAVAGSRPVRRADRLPGRPTRRACAWCRPRAPARCRRRCAARRPPSCPSATGVVPARQVRRALRAFDVLHVDDAVPCRADLRGEGKAFG